MKHKAGILGVLGAIFVLALMVMPAGVKATGYSAQVSLFSDNFDDQTDVDWDKWQADNHTGFSIAFDAMNIAFDTGAFDDRANWSNGIYTAEGFSNDTVYSSKQVYLNYYLFGEFYTGLIDGYYANSTGMSQEYAGVAGVVFNTTADEPFIAAWYVDTTNTVQYENLTVTLEWERWFDVLITYDDTNHTANINVTDAVTGASDNVDFDHMKHVRGDVYDFSYGWTVGFGGYMKGQDNQVMVHHEFYDVAYIDNVEVSTYAWVTVTPPVVTPSVDYSELFGMWFGIIGAVISVIGLIFYNDLKEYLADRGYLNASYIAAAPAIVGLGIASAGALLYYGYLAPYTGAITYHPSWAWW